MSDQYDDYYDYEQPQQQQQEQNIETTLQFENCQAQQLLRQNKFPQALALFSEIYTKASTNNIRTWKAKALTQLLELHVKMGNIGETKATLQRIRELGETDRTNQQSVKGIIKVLGTMDRGVYEGFWGDIYGLIGSLEDPLTQLKCYFLMLEKELQIKNKTKSAQLYAQISKLAQSIPQLPLSIQLQQKYLQLQYLSLQNLPISPNLRPLYIKLPQYEQDTNSNESYISAIKEHIAPTLYHQESYPECAAFLCGCFIENAKYGSNAEKNKEMLKVNLLVVLLCGDSAYLENGEYNAMLQESTALYKVNVDIQALFGLVEAFKNQDIPRFEEILKIVNLNLAKDSPYADIETRVLLALKKQKIISITKCYKTLKFSYLKKRINEPKDVIVQKLVFELLASNRVNGVIHLQEQYLEILPEENTYYTVQLENLRDLTERM